MEVMEATVCVSDLKHQIVEVFDDRIKSLKEEISLCQRRRHRLEKRVDRVVSFGKFWQIFAFWGKFNLETLEESNSASHVLLSMFVRAKESLEYSEDLKACLSDLDREREIRLSEARNTCPYVPGMLWGEEAEPVKKIDDLVQTIRTFSSSVSQEPMKIAS